MFSLQQQTLLAINTELRLNALHDTARNRYHPYSQSCGDGGDAVSERVCVDELLPSLQSIPALHLSSPYTNPFAPLTAKPRPPRRQLR